MSSTTRESLNSLNKLSHYDVGSRPPMPVKNKSCAEDEPSQQTVIVDSADSLVSKGSRVSFGMFDCFVVVLVGAAYFYNPFLAGLIGVAYLYSWLRAL